MITSYPVLACIALLYLDDRSHARPDREAELGQQANVGSNGPGYLGPPRYFRPFADKEDADICMGDIEGAYEPGQERTLEGRYSSNARVYRIDIGLECWRIPEVQILSSRRVQAVHQLS